MAVSKKTKNVLIVIASIAAAAVLGCSVWGIVTAVNFFADLPDQVYRSTAEAKVAVAPCFERVDAILESYGLQAEPYQMEEDSLWDYDFTTTVALSENEELFVSVSGDVGCYPYFSIILHKQDEAFFDLDIQQYPYICEIAAALSDNYFTKEIYASHCEDVILEAKEDLQEAWTYNMGGGQYKFFSGNGEIDYDITEYTEDSYDEEMGLTEDEMFIGWKGSLWISMFLY